MPAEDLVFLRPFDIDKCYTSLWVNREGERVRLLALLMHASEGHP